MKVLLMAYECSPQGTSERGVGWGRMLQAARVAETHVITSEKNYMLLDEGQRRGEFPADIRLYTPAPDAKLRDLEMKPVLFAYNYTAYEHWQELAMELAKALHGVEGFDLVHQVNVCTFREPGYTWQLGIPFLWGPVGGTQNFPPRFLTMLSLNEAVKEGGRGISNWLSLRMKSRVRKAAGAAAMILAANSTNQRDYAKVFRREVELLLETGIFELEEPDRERFRSRVRDWKSGLRPKPLKLLWIGELHTRKALPILLRALATLENDVSYELRVLGAGPARMRWAVEADQLRVLKESGGKRRPAGSVEFCGNLPPSSVMSHMEKADVFCFTSLRDTSGNVVLEALSAGVPVLCFDHQGARDMVSEACGIKIPVTSPRRAIRDWANAIRELYFDPERLLRLSEGATARAEKFLWNGNGDRVNAIYRELTGNLLEPAAHTAANETTHA